MATNNYSSDPYQQEILGLERQRETARKLRDQAIDSPMDGKMVSGWYVAPSWTEGAAKMLRAYLGAKGEEAAQQKIDAAVQRRTGERNAWVASMPQKLNESLPEGIEGPVRGVVNPKSEDYLNWASKGMHLDPAVAQMGLAQANLQEGRDQRKHEMEAKLSDAALARQQQIESRRDLAQMQQEGKMDLARLAASLRPAPQEKMISVMGPDGQTPTLVPQSQAKGMTPFVAGGKPSQAATAIKDANDAIGILRQSVPIVGKATSSGIGAGVDWLGNQFGVSTPGADAAAQMKVLGGALVSKMPKMSGPQSDKDVQLYKEMAGRIGDPTVPLSQKKQAMQTIYDLQVQYGGASGEPLFGGAQAPGSSIGKQGGSVFNVDQSAIDAEIARRRGGR